MSFLKNLFRSTESRTNTVTTFERARLQQSMPGEVAARAGSRYGWVG